MKIQVLFGSQNDERVFGPLCNSLQMVAQVKMDVASAHRHPEKVRQIMTESDADVFVAGAGLAAHLPGVVASLTKKPVFGVAVNGAFAGLDAFMSIAQMPKDIPVAALMENHVEKLAPFLQQTKNWQKNTLELYWNTAQNDSSLMSNILQELREKSGMQIEWIQASNPRCQGQILVAGEKPQTQNQGLCLYVCDKESLKNPSNSLHFFAEAQNGGFWVGVNNTTNFLLQIKKIKESVL